jgi:hypothetical protein
MQNIGILNILSIFPAQDLKYHSKSNKGIVVKEPNRTP